MLSIFALILFVHDLGSMVDDSEALIHVCYQQVSRRCPTLEMNSDKPLKILSVNFNSLDIIGRTVIFSVIANFVDDFLFCIDLYAGK